MYKCWIKYKEDIVVFCKILSIIIVIATFFGLSVPDKSKQPLSESNSVVETHIPHRKE